MRLTPQGPGCLTADMSPWFLTATERRDGSWVVRWAGVQLDPVPTESDAVDLLATLATELGGRELFDLHLHRTNGHVRRMSATEAHPRYKTPITRRLRGDRSARHHRV